MSLGRLDHLDSLDHLYFLDFLAFLPPPLSINRQLTAINGGEKRF